MALETATYIDGLVTTNPTGLDPKSQGDDHIRLLKSAIKATLPNITGPVTASQAELNILDGATLSTAELNVLDGVTATAAEINHVSGVTSPIQGQLDAKQPADADLTAIAGLASVGMVSRTGAGTAAVRTLTAGAGIQITNGDGVSGNPTIAVTASAGLGDVNGPVSATDNAVARYDLTTGKLLQNSNVTISDGGDVAGVASINGGQLAGLRNKIINGKMEIAQRGTSFLAVANTAYTLDRWWVVTDGVGTVNVSQVDVSDSGTGFRSAMRVERTAGTNRWTVGQNLETADVVSLRGSTVTLSLWVRKGAALTSNLDVTLTTKSTEAKFGATIDSAAITIANGSVSASAFTRVTLSLTIPSNSTAPGLEVSIQAGQAGAANAFFEITGVQLEVGSVATPFEHRPYGMELSLAQRYYYRFTPAAADQTLGIGHNTSTTAAVATNFFPVVMRVAPSALEQSGTAGNYSVAHAATSTVCSAVPTFSTASTDAATTTFTVASGLTAGQGSRARAVNTSAYLAWSAEL